MRSKFWQFVKASLTPEILIGYGITGFCMILADIFADLQMKIAVFIRIPTLILFVFFTAMFVKQAYKNWKLEREELHVPYFIGIPSSSEEAERSYRMLWNSMVNSGRFDSRLIDLKDIKNHFMLTDSYFYFNQSGELSNDPEKWLEFIQNVGLDFNRLDRIFPGRVVYHIGIKGPSVVALGIGAGFGTKKSIVAYQFIGGRYRLVSDLSENVREIKARKSLEDLQDVEFELRDGDDRLLVELWFASHEPDAHNRPEFADFTVLKVRGKTGGNLPSIEEGGRDWKHIANEVFNILEHHIKVQNYREIHLVASMPVMLAFLLGMAVGHFEPIRVYNYDRKSNSYVMVLELNKIRPFV